MAERRETVVRVVLMASGLVGALGGGAGAGLAAQRAEEERAAHHEVMQTLKASEERERSMLERLARLEENAAWLTRLAGEPSKPMPAAATRTGGH